MQRFALVLEMNKKLQHSINNLDWKGCLDETSSNNGAEVVMRQHLDIYIG